jgi:hypothetical protein
LKQQHIDAETGEVVERDRIAKGYEYSRGQYVTVDDDELKALQIESSKIVDLTQFVSCDEVDPVYLDTPYYVHPDGKLAAEAFQVIGEAMAAKGLVGIGRPAASGTPIRGVDLRHARARADRKPRQLGLLDPARRLNLDDATAKRTRPVARDANPEGSSTVATTILGNRIKTSSSYIGLVLDVKSRELIRPVTPKNGTENGSIGRGSSCPFIDISASTMAPFAGDEAKP